MIKVVLQMDRYMTLVKYHIKNKIQLGALIMIDGVSTCSNSTGTSIKQAMPDPIQKPMEPPPEAQAAEVMQEPGPAIASSANLLDILA